MFDPMLGIGAIFVFLVVVIAYRRKSGNRTRAFLDQPDNPEETMG